jgi:N-acetylglucosamine kinase-like BadF-type ATPase
MAKIANPGGCPMIVGVDAGGSKTLALVADASGRVLGRGSAGSANYQGIGFAAAAAALSEAIASALAAAGALHRSVAAMVMGLAGVGRPEDRARYLEWARNQFPGSAVQVVNDAELALAAGTPAGWGVALICGTGSIAVGRAPDGRRGRAGGWGPVLGDEGSGYALGRAALQAVMRASDGRGPRTALTEMVLYSSGLSAPEALVQRVYREEIGAAEIAGLAQLVDKAAAAGDRPAHEIVEQAAGELALAIRAVSEQLALGRPTPCALAGGVLVGGATVRPALLAHAAEIGLDLGPVIVVAEPAQGAVRLAQMLYADLL